MENNLRELAEAFKLRCEIGFETQELKQYLNNLKFNSPVTSQKEAEDIKKIWILKDFVNQRIIK